MAVVYIYLITGNERLCQLRYLKLVRLINLRKSKNKYNYFQKKEINAKESITRIDLEIHFKEKESAKSACKFKRENGQITMKTSNVKFLLIVNFCF